MTKMCSRGTADGGSGLRGDWDERYRVMGDALPAVLPRGLPARVNEYLNGFHGVLAGRLLSFVSEGGSVLDLGCGWGRLMRHVSSERPDLSVTGVDFSAVSCSYAGRSGFPAAQSDARHLPFRSGEFDCALAVTVFMYLHDDLDDALSELARVLRPGGVALLVDPSREYERIVRLFRRGRTVTTSGSGFALSEMRNALSRGGWETTASGSTYGLGLLLPFIMALRKCQPAVSTLLKIASVLDSGPGRFVRSGFHRWFICRRSPV